MDPPSIIYPSQSTNDEGLGASDDNGPEMKEPQLCGNDQVQVDAVINDQQQQQQHTTNQPQHYNLLSSPIPSFQQVVHIPTPQQLAQKMLVARRGGSNNNRWKKNEDEKLFGSELVLPIIPPPWEVSIDNNCTTNVATNNDAGNTTTFPAAQSDLPMSPLHQMTTTTLPLPVPITENASNVILSNGTIDHNSTPHIITNNNNNNNNNNGNISNNEQPPHNHHQTTTPTRVTTKNVTFNTHDKFHTYDVHLETLKHVDAEFFNVAYYLMDVVNVDIGNIEYYMSSFSSSIEDEEEKGGERLRRMGMEEGPRGGGGKNYAALQYEGTSNNGQSSSTSATTVGCTGGSVLSKLFSCGMIDISSNMFNFNDDDDEEEIIISQQQRKELGENSILRQQQQEQEQQHNTNNRRKKKRMYQLTNKLVNDFVLAVKYRMEIIENDKETTSSSVIVEGEANKNNINNTSTTTTSEVGNADNAVKRTKEIARKMYAYGLPLVGMIPHPKGIDDDEEEGDAIGLSAAAHKSQKIDNVGTLACDKKVDDDFMDTFGKGPHRRQYFPVLPTDNDDDNEDQYHENGATTDENDQYASNQLHLVTKGASPKKKKGFKLPTLSSVFSPSQPKSTKATPSEDECKHRLAQIKLEINKSTSMMNASQNPAVQKACQTHTSKLQDEKRFYQIIQERHNIQGMLETTQVESVRSACKERFKQLIYELETLQMENKDKYDNEENNDGTCNTTAVSTPPHEEDENEEVEDSQWFDRILQYVNESTPLHDERSAVNIMATAPTPNDYLLQQQSTMMGNFTPQSVARNYQDGQTMGNFAPQAVAGNYYPDDQDQNQYSYHHQQQTQHQRQSHPNNGGQILSPRRDTSNQRPPVAHAVKTRTQWI